MNDVKRTVRCPLRAAGKFYAGVINGQLSFVEHQDCATHLEGDAAYQVVQLLAVMTGTSTRDWITDVVLPKPALIAIRGGVREYAPA